MSGCSWRKFVQKVSFAVHFSQRNLSQTLTKGGSHRYNNFCLFGVIPMFLHVQELLSRRQPEEFQGSFDLAERFRDVRDVIPLSPLEYRLTADALNGRIGVTGELSCRLRLLCSRCLTPIDEPFVIPFEEQFQVMKESDPEPDEDVDFVPVTGERIDLRPFMEEELLVHLPLAPICSEDCKGLCPECGTNRNEQACNCKTERLDPRLEALQDWYKPE
jgi:uncharacterized protein